MSGRGTRYPSEDGDDRRGEREPAAEPGGSGATRPAATRPASATRRRAGGGRARATPPGRAGPRGAPHAPQLQRSGSPATHSPTIVSEEQPAGGRPRHPRVVDPVVDRGGSLPGRRPAVTSARAGRRARSPRSQAATWATTSPGSSAVGSEDTVEAGADDRDPVAALLAGAAGRGLLEVDDRRAGRADPDPRQGGPPGGSGVTFEPSTRRRSSNDRSRPRSGPGT